MIAFPQLDGTREHLFLHSFIGFIQVFHIRLAQFVGFIGINNHVCKAIQKSGDHAMHQDLLSARNDAKRLNEKIDGAKVKLEKLVSRLPG